MPFTFAHPAIVLPLNFLPKKWFSMTALVIGSMTPDFEYFLKMKVSSVHGHTLGGLIYFDLPLGLTLTFVFHNIVRKSLFENLPLVFKSRFLPYKRFQWNDYFRRNSLVVIISILIGALSHVFWDAFTHSHGYFVENTATLKTTVNLVGKDLPLFKILQHLSTLLGGLVLALAIYKMPKASFKKEKINLNYWILILGVTIGIMIVRVLFGLELKQYGNVIVSIISAGFLALIFTPLLLRFGSKTPNSKTHHS